MPNVVAINDTLTGVDDTLLSAHTPEIGVWTPFVDEVNDFGCFISSNRVTANATKAGGYSISSPSGDNMFIQAEYVSSGGDGNIVLNLRTQPSLDRYLLVLVPHSGSATIRKKILGSETTLHFNGSVTFNSGDIFKFEIIGNSLVSYRNDAQMNIAVNGELQSGVLGFSIAKDNIIDNLYGEINAAPQIGSASGGTSGGAATRGAIYDHNRRLLWNEDEE